MHILLRVVTPIILILFVTTSCTNSTSKIPEENGQLTDSQLADSVRYCRNHGLETDILSQHISGLDRQRAIDLQLDMLRNTLDEGASKVGWKMAGTVTQDSAKFDPAFGYILDSHLIANDSVIDVKNFPGRSVMVEGEVGFVLKNDLVNGVATLEELIANIDYVVGAVEFAKATAITTDTAALNINYVIASGAGQTGTIIGSVKASPTEFDFENETVKCFINGERAAEGVSTNIFGTPLNALFALTNLLPKHNQYLKAGDLVITGSMYVNPTIAGSASVRLEFSTLGTITFTSN